MSAMTVVQFASLANLSPGQIIAMRESGLLAPDLPPDQAGRARLLQALKSKGIPLRKLATLELPPGGQFVVYDHTGGRIDAFADPGRALARAIRCRGACTVAPVGEPAEAEA